jgi:predicted permease
VAALESTLKTSLEELRMQMLGVQVLFGFQLQGLFQETFLLLPPSVLIVDTIALAMVIIVLGLLLAVPCQHRIVEQGEASLRIFQLSTRYANYALLPLAAMISCDIYAATRLPFGGASSVVLASITFLVAVGAWYGAGMAFRRRDAQLRGDSPLQETKTDLHPNLALLPMICAIACDVWVALFRLQGGQSIPGVGALATACLLLGAWYVLPLIVRARVRYRAGHT